MAFFSHLFFVKEWMDGRYMTGINDGLSQMLPFKKLLYDEYTNGNFFYSNAFGLGGGIYSQLSYYFSTSIIFLITTLITFLLELLHLMEEPDIFYWANITLIISVIRMALIISFTTLFFRYMKLEIIPAYIGAALYGTSVIYFRHVTYWEFFADAMLWLPLLLLGIEKIMREKKPGLFTLIVSISLFDNFYFSYVHFLLAAIYILVRWSVPQIQDETGKIQQIKTYIWSGLVGLGISAVSFIPAVYGYLNNHRPPYEEQVPLYSFPDNPLLDGRIIIIPAFVILCLFMFSFYKNRLFSLFAGLTIITIFMHFSPMVASVFNGFSAPQYRWEYFLALAAGGTAASGLQLMHKVKWWQMGVALGGAFGLYVAFYLDDETLVFSSLKDAYEAVAAIFIVVPFLLYGFFKNRKMLAFFSLTILATNLYIANFYQKDTISEGGDVQTVSKEFLLSEEYNGKNQRDLIKQIKQKENDPFARIDWMIETRNNTPIVQDFKGLSVYSSILNKHLLYFYLYDLEIDMGRESVSRYASLGDRANLYSILGGKYYIAKEEKSLIPYGFEQIFKEGNYVAYKNQNQLPSIRTTDTVFLEKDLMNASPVAKERAMLQGIILNDDDIKGETVPENENIIRQTKVKEVGATYEGNVLDVTAEEGGLNLIPEQTNPAVKDYYVSFYLKSLEKSQRSHDKIDEFRLMVNDFETYRKSNDSIYKTNRNKITIRVPKDKSISIRLPKGKYKLSNLELYGEDYQLLESAKKKNESNSNVPISWSGNKVNISYDNQTNQQYMTLPIPYEKGWRVYINGKEKEVKQANYAFIGIALKEGMNKITLVYYPPSFFLSLFITCMSLITFLFIRKNRIKWLR
ncbi:MAG TPA: YfhO family protein [Virgibacillus sp.]|nr:MULTISPECIES: YfhO family protein [Virgibacillus]HLR68875.1 YfhO family protein [Virgibacillus sp.]